MNVKPHFIALMLWCGSCSYVLAQDTAITALSSMQKTQQHLEQTNRELETLRNSYEVLKDQSSRLLRTNDSIRQMMAESHEVSLAEQRQLYESNRNLLLKTFQDIAAVKQQVRNYNRLLDVTFAGTLISQLNNPTSAELGTSFSKVLLENADAILGRGLKGNQKSRFSETIRRVVSIPLVGTIVDANPITSLVKSVYDQAVAYGDNAIQDKDLRDFLNSIKPYTDFYYSLDQATVTFKDELLGYRRELMIFDKSLLKHEERLLNALQSTQTAEAAVNHLFRYTERQKLNAADFRRINDAPEVAKAIRLINTSPEMTLDQSAFEASFNNYVDQISTILERAGRNDRLQFDASTVDKLIRNLKNTRLK
ncbi:hypothetical protein M8998_15960 [Sphingobacterium sp. lm-10]|uniref:hypothetical protein n=1 Tax=Sphingobacterium sp. lm-10 TaxID=2944904 RepID=UPI00201FCE27|nr:hypothetical protein [Sphingobacterium sp. lm-10]MCL7989446.1 hypothetical protein [Sphingobacterium sp. lm-10]